MNKFLCLVICFMLTTLSAFAIVRDEFIEEELSNVEIEKPQTNTEYNYTSVKRMPIKLNIAEPITTKKDEVYEGQILKFQTKQDVRYKGKLLIKKGTPATAQIETYMSRGLNGIPAVIILDNFGINGLDKTKLKATYIKRGQNRTIIVLPIKWALTLIPGAGYSTNLILGGHASIKKKDTITVYYYPNWAEQI